MIIDIFLITFVVVYIIDFSGVLVDLSKTIWELTHPNQIWMYKMLKKPWGCSKCMSFWLVIIYCLYYNQTIIHSIAIGSVMSLSTHVYKLIINYYNKLTIK